MGLEAMMSMMANKNSSVCDNLRGGRPRRDRRPHVDRCRPSRPGKPVHVRYVDQCGWKLKRCYILLENLTADVCRVSSDYDRDGWDLRAQLTSGSQDGLLSPKSAAAILVWSQRFGGPIVSCKNRVLGCLHRSYWRIVLLHEDSCPYPMILGHNKVVAKLNLSLAPYRFGVFCRSFSRLADILLLYRRAEDVIKIRVMHYSGASRPFKMSFTDGKLIYDVSGQTGVSALISLPAWVMCSSSNLLTYSIELGQ